MKTTTDNKKTVLLVMDIQETMMAYLPDPKPLLEKVKLAISNARQAEIEIIYVVLSFRKGHPEINPKHKTFGKIKESGVMFTEGHEGTALHNSIFPGDGELILHKKRISAFAGSDLDMVLKAKHIDHLIISGFATSGIVLNTVRESADKDYHLTILSDACADMEAETHDFLMRKIFPSSGEVLTTAEWIGTLNLDHSQKS